MAVQMDARLVAGKDAGGSSPNRTRPPRHSVAKVGSVHVVIVSALFLVLFASTLMVGGHAAIDRFVQEATAPQDPRGVSSVVFTMPDRIFCRHVSFDNVTAQVREGSIERCVDDTTIARARARPKTFAWHND